MLYEDPSVVYENKTKLLILNFLKIIILRKQHPTKDFMLSFILARVHMQTLTLQLT